MEKNGSGSVIMRNWTRRITSSVAVVALLYLLVCVYMWAAQAQYIFLPEAVLQTTPADLGMKFEEVRIPVGDGVDQGELYGWWIPALNSEAPTFVYLHGNHRNIGSNLEHTLRLHSLGYNVLLMDYRGFGKSSGGKPSEKKVYEDAEASWQYLLRQRHVKPQKTFIYGHSLGGAIAMDLAVRHPEAAGLIIESTFTSMQAMSELEYGFLPVELLLNQRFEALKKIAQLKIPVLLIHGTLDKKVPVQMARQLYEAAPQPKTLVLIEGGEHGNSATVGWVQYRDALSAFMRSNEINAK